MAVKAKDQVTVVDVTDAYSVFLTSEAYTFAGNTSGAPSGLSCTTQVIGYCGSTACSTITVGTVSCPTGISATISNNNSSSPTITFKTTATVTSSCEATIPVTIDDVTINKKFSFAVAKTGATGATGATGETGTGVESITTEFYLSTSKTSQTGGSWVTTMPTWSNGKYLWTRDKIVYSNPTSTVYTAPVCDSSWEAANDAAKVATNYMNFDSNGLVIGDMTANTLGRNISIDADSVDIRNGDTVLASYGEDYIYLGKSNQRARIDLANGVGVLYNEDSTSNYQRLAIEANHSIKLSTKAGIYQSVYSESGTESGVASIDVYTHEPWRDTEMYIGGKIKMYVEKRDSYVPDPDGPTLYYAVENFCSSFTLDVDGIHLQTNNMDKDGLIDVTMNANGNEISVMADTILINSNITLYNQERIYGLTTDGTPYNAFELSSSDNMVYGYGSYENSAGRTHLYGNDIRMYIKQAGSTWYQPYFRAGNNVSGTWRGAGFVTSSGTKVYFSIPLAKPVIGDPVVTVTSVSGLMLRQGGKYTHGSSSSTYVKPSSYNAELDFGGNHVKIEAVMSDTTNVTNNDAIGIVASIKIAFS